MNAVAHAALVVGVTAVCASACGHAGGSASSGPPASPASAAAVPSSSAATGTTTETQHDPTGDAVKDTRAWLRALPANVAPGVSPRAALMPKSHGQVLVVGLTIQGPTVLQRRWACRFLYPHFRRVLPIGNVKAVIFMRLFGGHEFVGSTYAGDTRACADTKAETAAG